MERIGKSILTFLIALMGGLSPVWANQAAFADSVLQQPGSPAPAGGFHLVEQGDTYWFIPPLPGAGRLPQALERGKPQAGHYGAGKL